MFLSFFGVSQTDYSQFSNIRKKKIIVKADTTVLDSLSIIPNSFGLNTQVPPGFSEYEVIEESALLIWPQPRPKDTLEVSFRVFPFLLQTSYQHKDSSIIRSSTDDSGFNPGYAYEVGKIPEGYNSLGNINKSGYLSRGINVGNAQDLSVNSDLNLQLTGKLTDNLQLLASISDSNIPIQPGGNSQTLQDFDQVYINVFNDQFSLIGGDYQLRSRKSRYLTYFKRAQGANVTFDLKPNTTITHQIMASAAVSKGKYARNIFTATEGNQGPYRLTGAEGEQFVIVLAGTERVFIDGVLLERGEEFDYVIDYNSAELTFTPNQPITKDKRIQVEFQYSDKNYARSIFQFSDHIKAEKFTAYISAYSEQDAKNQTLQQDLSIEDQFLLSTAGDDLFSATISAIDSTGFTPEGIHYQLIDSLGYDSVFVQSSNMNLANYTLGFSEVGEGNGDYIQNGFTANGAIYQWVAPDTLGMEIIRNGRFAPFILLVSPKKQQVVAAGFESRISKHIKFNLEGAISNRDLNTFSPLDNQDNSGYSGLAGFSFSKDSSFLKSWRSAAKISSEINSENFSTTERFRSVEFLRDWNLLSESLQNTQSHTKAELDFSKKKTGRFGANAEVFSLKNTFLGRRLGGFVDVKTGKVKLKSTASYLVSESEGEAQFYRHKNAVSYALKKFRIGYQDELELNLRTDSTENGYHFHDYQFFIQNGDSTKNKGKIFYRIRNDNITSQGISSVSAEATQVGFSYQWLSSKKQSAKVNLSQRRLALQSDTSNTQAPENTILGRIEYKVKLLQNALNSDFFYQVGSGLEQRREYIYFEVPAGQGDFIWNDYNEDGVRDLNEFEIAAFGYEANFIRTFIPSNEYEEVFTNAFNANVRLDPARIWKSKKGVKKFLSKFSHQFSFNVDRKTTEDSDEMRFNPFLNNVNLDAIQALNNTVRNTLFYNRLSTKIGADFTIQEGGNKILLSNGLESRSLSFERLNLRWNYSEILIFKLSATEERKSSAATFGTGRDFFINSQRLKPEVIIQPNQRLKITLLSEITNKLNRLEGANENADLLTFGADLRLSSPGKGSLNIKANIIDAAFDGDLNTATAFEILEGLNPGTNFTWSALVQQNVAKNIQLSLGYFGRKSENSSFIHSGNLQVRALF